MRRFLVIIALSLAVSPAIAAKRGFKEHVTREKAAAICVAAYQYLEATGEGYKRKEQAARDYWTAALEELVPDAEDRANRIEAELAVYETMTKRTPVIWANVHVSSCIDEMEYELEMKAAAQNG